MFWVALLSVGLALTGVGVQGLDEPIISTNVCTLPLDRGNCSFIQLKWYYNYSLKKCLAFNYNGCGGNANKFDTKIACRLRCEDTCTLPNHYGDIFCLEYFPRWWYNNVTQQCEPFVYGGCSGTRNNFKTEEACFEKCDKTGCKYIDCSNFPCPCGYRKDKNGCRNKNCACECPCYELVKKCNKNKRGKEKCKKVLKKKKCPKREICFVQVIPCSVPPCPYQGVCKPKNTVTQTDKDSILVDHTAQAPGSACKQKPDSGCGGKNITRWAYFHEIFRCGCQKFFWTGQGGNGNNFETEADCNAACV